MRLTYKAKDKQMKFNVVLIDKENKEVNVEIDKMAFTPLTKANDNNLSFMDSFIDKANKALDEIVSKHNKLESYVDKENKPKSVDTVNQQIKRESEKVNMLTVLCKLLNKSSLNNDDIKAVLEYATYNNKAKTVYNITIGMTFNDIIEKYPNVKFKTIKEYLESNNLTIDIMTEKVVSKNK